MASKMLNLKIKKSSVGIVRWRQLAPKLEKYQLSSIKLFQVKEGRLCGPIATLQSFKPQYIFQLQFKGPM